MQQLETERKFDIATGEELPGLGGLVTVGEARKARMRATYFDTADLVLIRNKITLRRREGGGDEGWHVKLPADAGARLELHAPLGDGAGRMRVPAEHRDALAAALPEGLPVGVAGVLLPAAVLETDRLEIDLLDAEGRRVAVLCDDTVTALPEGRTWRELEVELAPDADPATGAELLDAITRTFADQGVTIADSPSKLARALGDRPARAESGLVPTAKDRGSDVLHAYLAQQVAVIMGREADVRADAPDAVHKTRVATRRLRSALRTFRALLDREVTDPIRDEVRWLGEVLGAPRDAEVMKAKITAGLDALPPELVHGPARERVVSELDRRHTEAHAALVEALDSERYEALLDRLVELLASPPWQAKAGRRAAKVLPKLVDQAVGRAVKDRKAADAAEGEERLFLLHETRKRAKAVRYAWEALAEAFGDDATAQAKAWERVTEGLGGLQDSVVADEWLVDLARVAEAAGEPTFSYGVLAGLERAGREESAAAGEKAMDEALRLR